MSRTYDDYVQYMYVQFTYSNLKVHIIYSIFVILRLMNISSLPSRLGDRYFSQAST